MKSDKFRKCLSGNDNGQFPKYAWPGGYPVFYVSTKMKVVCPACANADMTEAAYAYQCGEGLILIDTDANWEDPNLFCDICLERIESAYAEDDSKDGE